MTEIVEEERTLVHPDGYEAIVRVSRVSPGRYRFEEEFGAAEFAEVLEEYDDGAEPGMGWIVEVEELDDGRLKVEGVRPDPSLDYGSLLLPGGFHTSRAFARIGRTITELGGNWELFAWGAFTCYVPRDAAESAGFDLRTELTQAAARWPRSPEGAHRAVIECSKCEQRMWVPIDRGLLRVRCRRCDHTFYYPPIPRPPEEPTPGTPE